MFGIRTAILAVLTALTLPLAAAKAAPTPTTTNQYVSADTRLLTKPSAFGKSVRSLKKGTLVKAEKPRNGYIKVSVPMGEQSVTGFLPVRAVQRSRPKLSTAVRKSKDASAEEVAAATKGFNKQIEADLRDGGQSKGFERLDKALERTKTQDPVGQLEGFRKAGQLGEFKEGGE